MDNETIGVIVAIIFGVVGTFGGIPQLIEWLKPSPHLRLGKEIVVEMNNGRVKVRAKAYNERKLLKRNSDATNVILKLSAIDKNNILIRMTSGYVSACLVPNASTLSDVTFDTPLNTNGNPYTILVELRCQEGSTVKQKITYLIPTT